jgi:phosphate transport system substrate-binding protein
LSNFAQMFEAGMFDGDRLLLSGFSDGSGPAADNLALSRDRAEQVLAALLAAAPGIAADRLPAIEALGEGLPMACDETSAGRRLNRRVEVWAQPDFAKDTQPSGN